MTLSTEPPTLDWNLATDNVSYQILNQLMEGLTQYDDQLNPIPAIAESWDVLDGGKTYLFHLNKKYRWSDGLPVTAYDFQYSWLRLLNPKTAAEYAYFLFDIQGAQEFNKGQIKDESLVGIKALDKHTLEVQLKNPVVYFPSITTFMVTFPLRQDVIDKHGDRWTDPKNLVTCGPFILKEWWHEYRLRLYLNPHYGGKPKPTIEQLTIYLVSDPSTVLSLYDLGKLDVALLPPIALPQYKNHPDLLTNTKLRGYYYGFNIHQKPFDDVSVRQALALALDKSVLPDILKGGEKVANSWIPPEMFGFNENIGMKFNPKKARELLKSPLSPLWQRGVWGDLPTITLSFNSDPINKKVAEWAQAQWKKHLGIEVVLKNEEWKSYLSSLKSNTPGLFRLGWGADYPDPDNFMNLFTSYSGNNHTGWNNQEFDYLISQGSKEADPNKRQEIYDTAQRLLLEKDTVIIPLFVAVQNILVRQNIRPFPLIPMDFVYYKKVNLKPATNN